MNKENVRGICAAIADEIEINLESTRKQRLLECTENGKEELNESAFALTEAKVYAQELIARMFEELLNEKS